MRGNDLFLECAYSELPRPYLRHFHNAHELIYVRAGAARLTVGGRTYDAGPGSLLFLSKLEEHSLEILREPYRRYYLQLSPAQLDRMVEAPGLRSVFISRPPGFCHCFTLSEKQAELDRIFEALLREWAEPQSYSRHYTAALFNELLILCYRLRREQFPRPRQEISSAILEAQAYIDGHFAEEITVAALAGRFYLSTSYLSHAFKAWTGYSPQQYLLLSRISCAKELLLTTGDPVGEISVKCGFGDVSNFVRSFRKECGVPPGRYRKAAE